MHCPICKSTKRIEIDLHSDGYAKDLLECTSCGAIWVDYLGTITLLNDKVLLKDKAA